MPVKHAILAATFAIGTFGCVGTGEFNGPGETPTPPGADAGVTPTAGEAQAFFQENVQQVLAACTGEACHTGGGTFPPKFLGDGSDMYAAITAFPSVTGNYQAGASSLITTFQPAHPVVGALTPTYLPGQIELISQWLALEYDERGLSENLPANAPALQQFVGCMTLADWDASNMGNWANKGSANGECVNCHNQGLANFNTNDSNDTMFQMNRYEVFARGFFAIQVNPGTGAEEVVPALEKLRLKGGNQSLHPNFNTGDGNQNIIDLLDFYDRTMLNMANNNCGPAQFAVPPQI